MNNDNFFSSYGKEMPYEVPVGFFEQLPEQTLHLAKARKAKQAHMRHVFTIGSLSVAATVALIVLFLLPNNPNNPSDGQLATNHVMSVVPDSAKKDSVRLKPTTVKPVDKAKDVKTPANPKIAKPVVESPKSATIEAKPESLDQLLADMPDDMLRQMAAQGDEDLFIND
jgi:hypothetical protein